MKQYRIESPQFQLSFQLKVYEKEIQYPSNTLMTVFVNSDGFQATAIMDIDIKEFVTFADDLSALYESLKGSTIMKEPFGEQYIEFIGDGQGHISVRGELNSSGRNGFFQKLKFENGVDQTCLPGFLHGLLDLCGQYR